MATKAFNISMPEELVKKIDDQAKHTYRSRSQLIRELVDDYIREQDEWEKVFEYGQSIGRNLGYKSEEEVAQIVHEFRHGKK